MAVRPVYGAIFLNFKSKTNLITLNNAINVEISIFWLFLKARCITDSANLVLLVIFYQVVLTLWALAGLP